MDFFFMAVFVNADYLVLSWLTDFGTTNNLGRKRKTFIITVLSWTPDAKIPIVITVVLIKNYAWMRLMILDLNPIKWLNQKLTSRIKVPPANQPRNYRKGNGAGPTSRGGPLKIAAFVLNFKLCPPPDNRLVPLGNGALPPAPERWVVLSIDQVTEGTSLPHGLDPTPSFTTISSLIPTKSLKHGHAFVALSWSVKNDRSTFYLLNKGWFLNELSFTLYQYRMVVTFLQGALNYPWKLCPCDFDRFFLACLLSRFWFESNLLLENIVVDYLISWEL